MSRSNPNAGSVHPCTRWFEYKGGEGALTYWDKDRGENGERVQVKLPFPFVVLHSTTTVKGYSKARKCGIFANEIRDSRVEELLVKWNDTKEKVAQGLWNDIKDTVTAKRVGGGFVTKLYIGWKNGDAMEIGCIELAGCALGPWFDFQKKNRKALMVGGVTLNKGKEQSSDDDDTVKFSPPVFKLLEISEEAQAAAVELDKSLQESLTAYSRKSSGGKPHGEPTDAVDAPSDEDAEAAAQEEAAAALEAARAAARDRKAATGVAKPKAAIEEDPASDDVPF
jgi:hypothetical protein